MLENKNMIFDPFENRQCRDTRNQLASAVINAIRNRSMSPFDEAALALQQPDKPFITDYIQNRKSCLENILDQLMAANPSFEPENARENIQEIRNVAVLLWNHYLFFEFHEWLEELWQNETGPFKKALQALILAAVVYEQLQYDRIDPAIELAKKAAVIFDQQKAHIPEWGKADLFIKKFDRLDPIPPVLDMALNVK